MRASIYLRTVCKKARLPTLIPEEPQNRAKISILSTKGGGITMGIQPLQDWVLIEPSKPKEKTAGGGFIPAPAKGNPVEGKVLAVGKGGWEIPEKKWGSKPKGKEEKVFNPTVLKPGDQVLYEKYGTTPIDQDGKELVLVRESDVLGWNNKSRVRS